MHRTIAHICARWSGRFALIWIALLVLLTIASLFAFAPRHRATQFDTSLLPPGTREGHGIARSIIAQTINSPAQNTVSREALTESVDGFTHLSIDELQALIEDVRSLSNATLSRPEAESLVLSHTASVGDRFLLGTDSLGQDVLARLVHGARTALLVGIVAAGIATLLGITIGMTMGLGGPLIDAPLMRLTETVMSVPLLYVLVLAAGVLPRNTIVVMALIGCLSWHHAARYIRAECMKLRTSEYVDAARASGAHKLRVAFRHILPNAASPVIVDTSFGAAGAILVEATLSYLGLGAGDAVSWGSLVRDATAGGTGFNWWLGVFPGAMIFCTALSLVVLGERMRDAIDPNHRETEGGAWTYTARA